MIGLDRRGARRRSGEPARCVAEQRGVEQLDGHVLRVGAGLLDLLQPQPLLVLELRLDEVRAADRVGHQRQTGAEVGGRHRQPHGESVGRRRRVEVGAAERQRVGELLGGPAAPHPGSGSARSAPATPSMSRGSTVSGTSKNTVTAITYWPGQS